MVGVVVTAHGALAWGLMQASPALDTVPVARPMLVQMLSLPAAEASPPPVPTPTFAKPAPIPAAKRSAAMVPASNSTSAESIVEAPAAHDAMSLPAATPVASAASAEPTPPTSTEPARFAVASAAQYVEPPVPIYPRASRRAGEAGRVVLRVLVDEAGLPRQVLVHQSSGFARLDDAAIAAVQKARFKPYIDRDQAISSWVLVPLSFDLES
jgi:protein TonB